MAHRAPLGTFQFFAAADAQSLHFAAFFLHHPQPSLDAEVTAAIVALLDGKLPSRYGRWLAVIWLGSSPGSRATGACVVVWHCGSPSASQIHAGTDPTL
jgi:hypothetical protein